MSKQLSLKPLATSLITPLVWGGLLVIFSIIILTHLGARSLQSYDEAWYAAIARNMVETGSLFFMSYNGKIYTDHPPMAIWLMAAAFKFFGINEMAARLPSALTGIGCLYLMYGVALELGYKKAGGLTAMLMLGSSVWFLFRARSGNFDIPFIFFALLSIYLAIRSKERPWLLLLTGFALGALMLTKTLIGIGMVPAILVALGHNFWVNRRIPLIYLGLGIVLFGLTVYPWYYFNSAWDPTFLHRHFYSIGMRENSNVIGWQSQTISKNLLYLRSGIGKWYYPVLGSTILALGLVLKRRYRYASFLILVWLFSIGSIFMLSSRTEIWHLIPLYPPLFLLAAQAVAVTGRMVGRRFNMAVIPSVLVLAMALMAFWQIHSVWTLLIPKTTVVDAEADISRQAVPYPQPVYVMDYFLPAAVYYSRHDFVDFLWQSDAARPKMVDLLTHNSPTLFIAKTEDETYLQEAGIAYTRLGANAAYVLIGPKTMR